jgi:hypothetical protein
MPAFNALFRIHKKKEKKRWDEKRNNTKGEVSYNHMDLFAHPSERINAYI